MTTTCKMSSAPPRRGVAFSEYSELATFPKHGSKIWYTPKERQLFRHTLIRDARRMAKQIEVSPAGAIPPSELYECIGIEPFLTSGLALRLAEKKRLHVEAVLLEQHCQKARGVQDVERLAAISETSSAGIVERAQRLALGYSKLQC